MLICTTFPYSLYAIFLFFFLLKQTAQSYLLQLLMNVYLQFCIYLLYMQGTPPKDFPAPCKKNLTFKK
ncbi:hypothetical protein CU072_20100 [Bacillus thuringiensis]|uniref:Uncharacterized protein n=1 Tax=Bacillus thuringiensis TaxID=1428 RepID=A0A9X7GES9_BACTU|nr:hypothetical protein [Bacillus thuringiensis]MBG9495565.1 hypothetical protein [Bacillus thuringiensis]MBG9504100.1 hypothetical protein [Bacillus thuringiensis]MBG9506791.1 hypothetical protein [Bacillus thuringiensis]MBG9512833.1 hypothetical protein [Bacillus thuringiensis]